MICHADVNYTGQMKFIITIPAYNVAGLIGRTISSVLSQTHRDWTCVVMDDLSELSLRSFSGAACNQWVVVPVARERILSTVHYRKTTIHLSRR